jgi:hypothetical protein
MCICFIYVYKYVCIYVCILFLIEQHWNLSSIQMSVFILDINICVHAWHVIYISSKIHIYKYLCIYYVCISFQVEQPGILSSM